ncbi:SAG-related sequence SRS33 [Besnoitia besnoiti]|uniref:SAG-related sequence SRS33 n=1 Tax=Besnoitia besnoiti TaxID=94643 RepID=A0A2A9M2X4_BESBE|nr:SAG-related sequence SRS33 [Besnoitia besnoiti]PFH32838.1 SAG-related sequence SRS33 [Besnoitia besnoiti]
MAPGTVLSAGPLCPWRLRRVSALAVVFLALAAVDSRANVIRKITFESCDSRNQKVILTVNPGDSLFIRCAGAVNPVPKHINVACCHDTGARCTEETEKTYQETFPSAPPEFIFSYGDGINSAWQLKIPESTKAPYPSFSVGWQGPPSSLVNNGVRTAPQTTVVIRVEEAMDSEILVSITSTISRSAAPASTLAGSKQKELLRGGVLAALGLLVSLAAGGRWERG